MFWTAVEVAVLTFIALIPALSLAGVSEVRDIRPGEEKQIMFQPASGPLSFSIINRTGNIRVVPIDGNKVTVNATDLRYVDQRTAKFQVFEPQPNKFVVGVYYPAIEVPSPNGDPFLVYTENRPEEGIVLRNGVLSLAGVFSVRGADRLHLNHPIRGGRGELSLEIGVPAKQLGDLSLVSVTGDIIVSDFPSEPLDYERVILARADAGLATISDTVASGGFAVHNLHYNTTVANDIAQWVARDDGRPWYKLQPPSCGVFVSSVAFIDRFAFDRATPPPVQ